MRPEIQQMRMAGIYLREQDEQVGPFHTRQDAEHVLILMELFGVSCEGIEIVELDTTAQREESVSTLS